MSAYRRARRAFTLIELIVVVVIIAVLAAIAAVAYNQYAAKARSNAVLGSAASLRTAVMAAAARDDQSPAAEVDALWTAADGSTTTFLKSLSASYTGPLTYTADGDSDATLQVGAANGGTHAACLTLPDTVSGPVTIASGTCTPAVPAAPTGPVCVPAPTPMPGCEISGALSASAAAFGTTPQMAVDGDLGTYWDSGSPNGTWTDTWDGTHSFNAVVIAAVNSSAGQQTYTVSGLSAGSWTQIGQRTVSQPAGTATAALWSIPVTAGAYSGVRVSISGAPSSAPWMTVNAVSLQTVS